MAWGYRVGQRLGLGVGVVGILGCTRLEKEELSLSRANKMFHVMFEPSSTSDVLKMRIFSWRPSAPFKVLRAEEVVAETVIQPEAEVVKEVPQIVAEDSPEEVAQPAPPADIPAPPADTPAPPADVPVPPADIPVPPADIPTAPEEISAAPEEIPAATEEVSAAPEEISATPTEVSAVPAEISTPTVDPPAAAVDVPAVPAPPPPTLLGQSYSVVATVTVATLAVLIIVLTRK